jgi:hypothetical protein
MRKYEEGPLDANDARLAALFASYREACPDPEPSAEFMPRLWQKIDSRQSSLFGLKRLAQGIVTAAAAACLLMGAFLASSPSAFNAGTYLESLAADQAHENPADVEIVQIASSHERN